MRPGAVHILTFSRHFTDEFPATHISESLFSRPLLTVRREAIRGKLLLKILLIVEAHKTFSPFRRYFGRKGETIEEGQRWDVKLRTEKGE